ncbi:MAG: circularly permuted type 2 ATP-grasp protein, partial [Pseudomonadota bacterium]
MRISADRDVADTLAFHSADNSRSVSEAIEALDNDNTAIKANAPAAIGDLTSGYGRNIAGYDEMLAPDGSVRPHWQTLVSFLQKQGADRGHATTERIQRRIVENGLTLDSFADPDNADQPWHLDLIPFILSSEEFAFLENACIQRISLYEALLNDLYGEQQLLAENLLPSGLVFNDPTFLRPLHGIPF